MIYHGQFAERVRAARGRARLSLREVGNACGVSPQAVKKWEDGGCYPSSGALIALCRALDCSAEWLLDPRPLDFRSTFDAPDGKHAKYWVRAAIDEIAAEKVTEPPK